VFIGAPSVAGLPAMTATATGSFPIGFRRMGALARGDLRSLALWARESNFAHLDLAGPARASDIATVTGQSISVGTIDLVRWSELLSPYAERRLDAAAENAERVRILGGKGLSTFFAVATPEDPTLPRAENFSYAVESYRTICRAAADAGARVALEGAPGKPPHFATIGCTPADLRALLAAVGSPALGVNFDPSHAVRMGIDPLRMLREFAPQVFHIHAKDAIVCDDTLYEHGHLQQATFARPHTYGAYCWRYAMPGKGSLPWREMLGVLKGAGYAGRVSIEIEDEDVEGEEAERAALIAAKDFLAKT
jgi:sugar phosphate isomerase/epimerase